jgi:hypothetical protein
MTDKVETTKVKETTAPPSSIFRTTKTSVHESTHGPPHPAEGIVPHFPNPTVETTRKILVEKAIPTNSELVQSLETTQAIIHEQAMVSFCFFCFVFFPVSHLYFQKKCTGEANWGPRKKVH